MSHGVVEEVGVEVGAGLKAERVLRQPFADAWIVVAPAEVDKARLGIGTLAGKSPGIERRWLFFNAEGIVCVAFDDGAFAVEKAGDVAAMVVQRYIEVGVELEGYGSANFRSKALSKNA